MHISVICIKILSFRSQEKFYIASKLKQFLRQVGFKDFDIPSIISSWLKQQVFQLIFYYITYKQMIPQMKNIGVKVFYGVYRQGSIPIRGVHSAGHGLICGRTDPWMDWSADEQAPI